MASPKAKAEPVSLIAFAQAERRASCEVCKLPDEIRAQIRSATEKKINRPTQLKWLIALGYKLDDAKLDFHGRGGHDRG